MDKKSVGVLAVLAASLMWAVEPVLAKLSYQNADFFQTSAVRAFFVMLTALAFAILTRGSFQVENRKWPAVFYVALAATVFADLLYFYALVSVPVLNAVLIGHLQPVFVVFLGFLFVKNDKLSKFDYAGIALMLFAAVLVTSKSVENLVSFNIGTLGDLMVFAATFAWATTAIAVRKHLTGLNSGVLTFYRYLIALIVFVFYSFSATPIFVSNPYQVLVGVVVGGGMISYYEGLKRLKAAQVSSLELASPFFAAVLGFFALGEGITLLQLLGVLLLFFGVKFLSKKEPV